MKAAVVKKISNDDSVNWKEYPLEEVLDVIRGISFKSTEKLSEKGIDSVACLRTANVQADVDWDDLWWVPESFVKRQEQFVRQHDILMSNANSYELVGKVSLVKSVPTKATLGAFITLLRSREGFDPKFLFYQLRSARLVNEIRSRASTTTNISNVSTGKLRDIPLFCPSLEQQKKIVAKIEELFSHIDAGINALKQSKQLLKQYRQSVLKAAVTGELSKEWREQNKDKLEPASKLLERILEERRQKWEAQQLEQFKAKGKVPKDEGWKAKYKEPELLENDFDVPEGWVAVTLEAVAEILSGFAFKSGDFSKNGVPAIKIANVSYGEFIWKQQEYLPTDFLEKHNEFSVKPGDILLALTRPITNGNVKACLYPQNAEAALLNQRVCCIKEGVFLDKAYLLNVLQSDGFKRQVEDGVTETLQPNLSPNDLKKFYVLLPSLDEQRYIAEEVENKLSSQLVAEGSVDAELQRSERLKQSVLQSAFGGSLLYE